MSYFLNAASSQVTFLDTMAANLWYCPYVASVFKLQDVPEDPTGELDKVQKFVMENLDICKWVSLGVVLLEVSAILTSAISTFHLSVLMVIFPYICEQALK